MITIVTKFKCLEQIQLIIIIGLKIYLIEKITFILNFMVQ